MADDIVVGSLEESSASSTPNEKSRVGNARVDFDHCNPRTGLLSRVRWVILCASLLLVEVQAALDSTITADLQPAIIDALGEIAKFPWINVSYSLGLGGSCLLW